MAGRHSQPTPPSVLAHLRPDRVGQDGGRRGDRGADPGRARLRRLDAGLPRPADPDEPGRRRAARRDLAARPPGHRRRVPGARARGDRRDRRGGADADRRRRLRALVPGGARPTSSCRPTCPAGAQGALGASLRPPWRGRRHTRSWSGATRVRPRVCTRTIASASFGRSSSGRRAARSCRSSHASGRAELRLPTARRRPRRVARDAGRTHPRAHARDVRAGGGGRGARRGRRGAAGARPRRRADAAARARRSPSSSARRSASPPTSASGCAGSRASS